MPTEFDVRLCPYCKEEIRADAIRCKHCRSALTPQTPGHGGTCPSCKEAIHPDALRCKHCGASVGPEHQSGCGCVGPTPSGASEASWLRSPTAAGSPPSLGKTPPTRPGIHQVAAPKCGTCESWQTNFGTSIVEFGVRTCFMLVPIPQANGSIRWEQITWVESCGGPPTLVTNMP